MPQTLLLADDSSTIQRVVTLMFANEGIRVVAVADGDAALAALQRDTPDIVLADVDMPGPDGYALAAQISGASGRPLPVLLLAGAFDVVDEARAAASGAAGVLTKPLDPGVVVSRVRGLLGLTTTAPATAPAGQADARLGGAADAMPAAEGPPAEAQPSEPQAAVMPGPADAARLPDAAPRPSPDVDRYFEDLDAAFASLATKTRPILPPEPPPGDEPAAPPSGSQAPAPLALTDAFTALLAAEQAGLVPTVPPVLTTGRTAAPIDLDALVEQVAERVLARLTDTVVRQSVADTVTATAERLVREEIDRIKRHIT